MSIDEIIRLIQAVSDNGLSSFEYERGDEKLVLKKKKNVPQTPVVISQAAPIMTSQPMNMASAEAQPAEAEESKKEVVLEGADTVITAPLVGTFYSASSPEAEPFVKIGDHVKKGQVLGVIEAMKLMNDIESEVDGVVQAILVGNEEVVEYGQPLFRIR